MKVGGACGAAWQAARDPEGTPVYRRNWRVANPPQDAILPHEPSFTQRFPKTVKHPQDPDASFQDIPVEK